MSTAVTPSAAADDICLHLKLSPRVSVFIYGADAATRLYTADLVADSLKTPLVYLDLNGCENSFLGAQERIWAVMFPLWEKLGAVVAVNPGVLLQERALPEFEKNELFLKSLSQALWTHIEKYHGVVIVTADANFLLPEISRRCYFIFEMEAQKEGECRPSFAQPG
jgi:hypothetical protein